jgi:hypothetical protein
MRYRLTNVRVYVTNCLGTFQFETEVPIIRYGLYYTKLCAQFN